MINNVGFILCQTVVGWEELKHSLKRKLFKFLGLNKGKFLLKFIQRRLKLADRGYVS